MLARSNGPVLDAQRTFKYQTATVLRGAYLQPLSRALTRPHALTRTVAAFGSLPRSTPRTEESKVIDRIVLVLGKGTALRALRVAH